MSLQPGTRVGSYEIVAPIGAGAMGEVYRARDLTLGRDVAVKVIAAHLLTDASHVSRFDREARLLAALNHPNVAAIYGVERTGGIQALILELVDGPTLADRLSAGPVPLADVLNIAAQIAAALEAAHARGIVHRDLKPANIKLTKESGAKVLDFGLAVAAAGSSAQLATVEATSEGTFTGTAPYMSPEQARGEILDTRTDIWAFGCILFEMLARRRAFPGENTADVIAGVLTREPDWGALPRETPPLVARLARRCLQKDARQRLHSIADARLDLEEAMASGPAAAVTGPEGGPRRRAAWSLPLMLSATAITVALATHLLTSRAPAPSSGPYPAAAFGLPDPAGESLYLFVDPVRLSPDGTRIAMVTNSSEGRSRIWLRSLDALTPEPLEGTDGATFPFWSPDGRSLAFNAAGQLKVIELSTRTVRRAADTPTLVGGGAWSRNGTLLFTQGMGQGLGVVPAVGGEVQPVTFLDASRGEVYHGAPHFVGDGDGFIYFAKSTNPGQSAVMFGRLGTDGTRRILALESPAVYASPGHLIYGRGSELVAHKFDATRGELEGDPIVIADRLWNSSGFVVITASANGVLAFAPRRTPTTQLTWVGPEGRPLEAIGEPGEWVHVELSPDERWIAAERLDARTGTGAIWVGDVQQKTFSRLSADTGWDIAPVWSPDAAWLAFGSSRRGGSDLFRKRLDATDTEILLASEALKQPTDVLADGTVVFTGVSTATGADVWEVRPGAGEAARPVVQGRFNESTARISPDEQWLAYVSNESGRTEVYVRHYGREGGRWRVSQNGASQPRWRRDGRELFFVDEDGTLMAADIAAGAAFRAGVPRSLLLGTTRDIMGGRFTYDVADSGRRFLVNRATGAETVPAVAVVLNWTARLRK